MPKPPRTAAQRERQSNEHRDHGRYATLNPCYVCGRSAGVNYFSHASTDCVGPDGTGDALLVLCPRCARATDPLTGPEAIAWATRTYPDHFGRGGLANHLFSEDT